MEKVRERIYFYNKDIKKSPEGFFMAGIIKSVYTADSFTSFSPHYRERSRILRTASWYDVRPYSQTLWAHSIVERILREEWWCYRSNLPWMCLEYLISGTVLCEQGDAVLTLKAGDLLVTHPGDTLRVKNADLLPVHQIRLMLSGSCLRLLIESLGLAGCRQFSLPPAAETEIHSRLNHFFQMITDKSPTSTRLNSQKAYEFLLFLTALNTRTENPAELPLFTKAVRNMEADLESSCSVSRLADGLGISVMTLNRMFHRYFGTSPKNYWNKLRLDHAYEQVTDSSAPFKEIAIRLGFHNPLYFSTVFKRRFGLTPTQCRQQASNAGLLHRQSETRLK